MGRHSRIELGFFHFAGVDQAGQILRIGEAGHVHVEAGVHGFEGCVFGILGVAMGLQCADGPGIGDHETLEAPLLAENVGEQPVVSSGGHIVQVHVGAHEGAGAGLLGRMEGDKI